MRKYRISVDSREKTSNIQIFPTNVLSLGVGVGYTGTNMPFSPDEDEHSYSAFYTMYLGRKKPFFLIWTQ